MLRERPIGKFEVGKIYYEVGRSSRGPFILTGWVFEGIEENHPNSSVSCDFPHQFLAFREVTIDRGSDDEESRPLRLLVPNLKQAEVGRFTLPEVIDSMKLCLVSTTVLEWT